MTSPFALYNTIACDQCNDMEYIPSCTLQKENDKTLSKRKRYVCGHLATMQELSTTQSCDLIKQINPSHMLSQVAGLLMVQKKKPFRVRFHPNVK